MVDFKRSQLDTAVDRLREKLANADLRTAARQLERELSGYGVPDAAALVTAARQRLESELGKVRPKYSLKRDERQDWYAGPRDDGIWPLLQQYLLAPHGKGWPERDVRSINDSSTDVVAQLDPPNQDSFSTRGLVLGYVQSGKTANMTAVIAKAVDAGFRMVIVLAGTTDKLREQTQLRLEKDLVGLKPDAWHCQTNADSDYFPGTAARLEPCHSGASHARLFVVKKITAVLQRLVNILKASGRPVLSSCPTLIIDDESDQASVNASGKLAEYTATNRLIRELIHCLPKASYVGYTATPFANILINPEPFGGDEEDRDLADDLYPGDFITSLPRPDSYFGAERLFGRSFMDGDDDTAGIDGLDMIRTIPKSDISLLRPSPRNKDQFTPQVSPSLELAIRWFIIATAAKNRLDTHSTMLVHISHLVEAHEQLAKVIEQRVDRLKDRIRDGDSVLMSEMRTQWDSEYPRVSHEIFGNKPRQWSDFENSLADVVAGITVAVENSASDNRLDYERGPRTYIAIGGHVLARGLTMEGLIASYFLRTSKQYDTLMQMGRWFGYRPGYEELPRLWAAEDVVSAFREMATVESEIREDIAVYRVHDVTPRDFAVRIREVPGMMVTARNKMTSAVRTNISFEGRHVQTLRFSETDERWLDNNWRAASSLADGISEQGLQWQVGEYGRYVCNVPFRLITRFLGDYQSHVEQKGLDTDAIRKYIANSGNCNGDNWVVGIIEPRRGASITGATMGRTLGAVKRVNRAPLKSDETVADIKALMSRQDMLIDMQGSPFGGQSWDEIKEMRQKEGAGPLLLLYVIDKASTSKSQNRRSMVAVADPLGFGLVFPGNPLEPKAFVEVDLSCFAEPDPEEVE